jgi:amidase
VTSAELGFETATSLAAMLAAGEISATELVTAQLERIERLNPLVNAIVTLVPERALAEAAAADRARARGEALGPLHGLPIAIKDLVDTAGIRTTYGSPLYREHVPETDALLVERVRRAGAIVIGKTNTPEFGAGSQTFNPVFGPTLNPYDRSCTAGGSSGGAAAALAAGLVPLADGTDLGGSLRNPASFCNVVGLRPTPGRVPSRLDDAWDPLGVAGPMARTVADISLLLAAVSGHDELVPLSLLGPGPSRQERPARVAWSTDLGGLPLEPGVNQALEQGRVLLEAAGCIVEDAEPDLGGADEAFYVLRALSMLRSLGSEYEEHRSALKDTVVWNIEAGLALTPERIAQAQMLRTAVFTRTAEFLRRYDALAAPVTQVEPFPVEIEWPREIAGTPMETYIDWMRSCSRISVTAHPAISVPCGFTETGFPVGLQLVGRYGGEAQLLALAAVFEASSGAGLRRPPL